MARYHVGPFSIYRRYAIVDCRRLAHLVADGDAVKDGGFPPLYVLRASSLMSVPELSKIGRPSRKNLIIQAERPF